MRTILLALLVAALPLPLIAQTSVVLRGRGDPTFDARLRELVREPGRTWWTRDTLIARSDTVREPLLIVGATVRLEGTLLGDVVAVGADLFIRPSARVQGAVLNVAGGWYASDLATVSGRLDNRPDAPYAVEHGDAVRIIRGTREPRLLSLAPLVPGYDRVDAFSPAVRARLLLPAGGRLEPSIETWAGFHSARGRLDGGAAALLARGKTSLALGVERTTLTNDGWIRGPISNAISYLWDGTDVRDYYQARRSWVELRHRLEQGARMTTVWVRGQVEDAHSLNAGDPWTLFEPDSTRPNRPVDDGRISSLLAGATVSWRRPTFETVLAGATEYAVDAFDSDFIFRSYRLDLAWAMPAFRNHTLEIAAHAQGPLPFGSEHPWPVPGGQPASCDCTTPPATIPRQRWSHVGGSGTLHTFGDAAFQGSRVLFVESRYGIPLGPSLRLPFLGAPTFELLHAAGMAWTRDASRHLEQNVGFRLRYNLLYLRFLSNPANGDIKFNAGVAFPRRAYAWQPAGGFF
ncbi:MAG: hypothetical protein FIB01_07385 [Gemmatimonadetes bacterium]|nr:hypothetical protein [Gemmatimonadota bacterium]